MRHDTTTRPASVGSSSFASGRQFDAQQCRRRSAAGAVAAIQMSGYRVIVTERCTRGLVDRAGTSYVGPPQTKQQARSLIALLARATAGLDEVEPRRQPVAGSQRTVELEHQQ